MIALTIHLHLAFAHLHMRSCICYARALHLQLHFYFTFASVYVYVYGDWDRRIFIRICLDYLCLCIIQWGRCTLIGFQCGARRHGGDAVLGAQLLLPLRQPRRHNGAARVVDRLDGRARPRTAHTRTVPLRPVERLCLHLAHLHVREARLAHLVEHLGRQQPERQRARRQLAQHERCERCRRRLGWRWCATTSSALLDGARRRARRAARVAHATVRSSAKSAEERLRWRARRRTRWLQRLRTHRVACRHGHATGARLLPQV